MQFELLADKQKRNVEIDYRLKDHTDEDVYFST